MKPSVTMPDDDDAKKKKPRASPYPPGKDRWGRPVDKAPREYEKLRPLVICGPSGVGKGTLIDKLVEDFPERFGFSVSHTTRKPRPGEKDAADVCRCSETAERGGEGGMWKRDD